MKASELMKGNLVLCNEEVKEVYEFNHNLTLITFKEGRTGTYSPGLGNFKLKPIPLTEDWLIKTDLKKQPKELFKNAYYLGNGLFIFMDGPKPKIQVQAQTSGFMIFVEILEIDYVHTFQNFMYILTGNEITFKPKDNEII